MATSTFEAWPLVVLFPLLNIYCFFKLCFDCHSAAINDYSTYWLLKKLRISGSQMGQRLAAVDEKSSTNWSMDSKLKSVLAVRRLCATGPMMNF